jgi:hypothetical protein
MRDEFQPWFKNNLLGPHGMNDIIYTAQYFLLSEDEPLLWAWTVIDSHIGLANSDGSRPISHDNLTALVCLISRYDHPAHRLPFRPEHAYKHPRDFFFYAANSASPFWRVIGGSFLWVTSLAMIWGLLFRRYKNIDGARVETSDGELLTWLRLNCTKMPLTKRVCDAIVRWRYGGWRYFFNLYYKDNGHPNRVLANERGI